MQLDIRARAEERRADAQRQETTQDETAQQRRFDEQRGRQNLREVIDRRIEVDPKTRAIVLRKTDRDTGEVVEQLPDETMLKLRALSREMIERDREAAVAAQPPNPVPGPPVEYACEANDELGIWDDQYFPEDEPLCDVADETFTLCLQAGEFVVSTPSVDAFAASIVEQYLGAGASAGIGKCFKVVPRMFWLCYGAGANSLGRP